MELLSPVCQNAFQALSDVTEGDYVLLKADGINGKQFHIVKDGKTYKEEMAYQIKKQLRSYNICDLKFMSKSTEERY